MTNKLSELSKPVMYVVRTLGGSVASVKSHSYTAPKGFTSEPLYSQEYVSALDKVAQYWIGESAGWKKRAEDAEKRIAELERANQSQDDHINQQQDRIDSLEKKNGDLWRSLGAAEKRLAKPVRLPALPEYRHNDRQEVRAEKDGFISGVEESASALRKQGFTVEGDEYP
ncbi:TPA: hypothetical protein ACXNDR_001652 [Serratia marcescens]